MIRILWKTLGYIQNYARIMTEFRILNMQFVLRHIFALTAGTIRLIYQEL